MKKKQEKEDKKHSQMMENLIDNNIAQMGKYYQNVHGKKDL